MHKFAAIRMHDLKAMISRVRYSLNANHALDVHDVSPRHNGYVDVGHVRKPLQDVLGLGGQDRKIRMRGNGRQGAVVVQQQG